MSELMSSRLKISIVPKKDHHLMVHTLRVGRKVNGECLA